MIDVPLLHALLGETYAAQKAAEREAAQMEERYNRAVTMTSELIRGLKDGAINIDDVEVDETGWRVKRAD